jgi:hypothetical protein
MAEPHTLTFLFTDVEGSTSLWEKNPEVMSEALLRHDEILRTAIEAHDGHVFKTVGFECCSKLRGLFCVRSGKRQVLCGSGWRCTRG